MHRALRQPYLMWAITGLVAGGSAAVEAELSDYTASVLRSWLLMANTAAREAKAAGGAPRDLLALSPRDLQPLDPWAYALALPRSQMDLCFESVEMSDEDLPF